MKVINLTQRKKPNPIRYDYNFSFFSDIELTDRQKREIAKKAHKKLEKVILKVTKEKVNKYDIATYIFKKKP